MPMSINSVSSLYHLMPMYLYSVVIFSSTQKGMPSSAPRATCSHLYQCKADGNHFRIRMAFATCLVHCGQPPPFGQMQCNGDSSLRPLKAAVLLSPVHLPMGLSIKFSARHIYWNWGNQGFIKCPIRCKIHFAWSCKGNFCNKVKRSHCQIFQRNNVYRLRLIPFSLLELQPYGVSVSQSRIRFWLILKHCIAEPLTRCGKWVEKLLVANK